MNFRLGLSTGPMLAHPAASRRAALKRGVGAAALACGLATALAPEAQAARPRTFSGAWTAALVARAGSGHADPTARVAGPSRSALATLQRSLLDMRRAAASIAGARTFQAQAALLGSRPGPDGLAIGALEVAPGAAPGNALWLGAALPTQTQNGDGNQVTVQQNAAKALLTWNSFNVGRHTTLTFDQSAGGANARNWVVLNRLTSSNTLPSSILGSISAPGKVYVINRNGVIFGASSQVNTAALLVSTAPFRSDPGNSADQRFLNSGIYFDLAGSQPTFVGGSATAEIVVAPGAQINTAPPASPTAGGGYVFLLGGSVVNAGSINTPHGQTILAAGTDFTLRAGYSPPTSAAVTPDARNQALSTTVGTEVIVANGGAVTNAGLVTASLGDITLAGHSLTQSGVLLSSTSVNSRGTIHLVTDTADTAGLVTLGAGSTTAILLDTNGGTLPDVNRTALVTLQATLNAQREFTHQLADRLDQSRVEITTGGSVEFGAGSLTLAPGGQVAVTALNRVQVEADAHINVAGASTAMLPVSANLVSIDKVEPFELRDSPVNRLADSLRNVRIELDGRNLTAVAASPAYGSTRLYSAGGLIEASGYANGRAHGIDEWEAAGGSITLQSSSVVARAGSVFNVAGGAITYTGGKVAQTWLIGSDGRLYNANTATDGLAYRGVYQGFKVNHPHWNVTQTFRNPLVAPSALYQPGYVLGRDAGSVTLAADTVIFSGEILGTVLDSPLQSQRRGAAETDSYALGQRVASQAATLALTAIPGSRLTTSAATVSLVASGSDAAERIGLTDKIAKSLVRTAVLGTDSLNSFGLAALRISAPSISVEAPLVLAAGGTLELRAATIDIAANVTVPSGTVRVTDALPASSGQPIVPSTSGAQILLRAASTVDVRGVWTNTVLEPQNAGGVANVDGGNITFDSSGALLLAPGAALDASAGAALRTGNKLTAGRGGNVTLIGDNPAVAGLPGTADVTIGAAIRAFGVAGGGVSREGSLLIDAPTIEINSTGIAKKAAVAASASTANPAGGLVTLPALLFQSGFSSYEINGYQGLTVAAGTNASVIVPQLFAPMSDSVPSASAADLRAGFHLDLAPLFTPDIVRAQLTQRPGASVTLRSAAKTTATATASDIHNLFGGPAPAGSITLGAGSRIAVDPGNAVTIEGYDQVTVLGTISAPAGSISILNDRQQNVDAIAGSGRDGGPKAIYRNDLSIWIGGASRLDASGIAATAADAQGRPFGTVLAGGTITLGSLGGFTYYGYQQAAAGVFVLVRPGATIDASGASAVIDLAAGTGSGRLRPAKSRTQPVVVASSGGTISAASYAGIALDGTLRAAAGGAGADGGTLRLVLEQPFYNLGTFDVTLPPELAVPRILDITRDTTTPSADPRLVVGQPISAPLLGSTRLSVQHIDRDGFSNLDLFARDAVRFDGDITLAASHSIRLQQGVFTDTTPNSRVHVVAPQITLNGFYNPNIQAGTTGFAGSLRSAQAYPIYVPPATTSGSLTFNAGLIDITDELDIGYGALAGFRDVTFASSGDIRFALPLDPSAAPALYPGPRDSVVTSGNLTFSAARLYPASGVPALILAGLVTNTSGSADVGFQGAGAVTFVAPAGADQTAPESIGGILEVHGGTITQAGNLFAPLGTINLGGGYVTSVSGGGTIEPSVAVTLAAGSLTSVGLGGRSVPFGGTTDDTVYTVGGGSAALAGGLISLTATDIALQPGSTLDVSGGGTLSGAGFISGRGGSVDARYAPLLQFNPAAGTVSPNTLTSNPVYAILPGFHGYAPLAPVDNTSNYAGAVPQAGRQITIGDGVPGLPAGTYTLLPATYALQSGAYRVELDLASHPTQTAIVALANGSYRATATQSLANTGIASPVPIAMTVTPGRALRNYSAYDEESYAQFAASQAAKTGAQRPTTAADSARLLLGFTAAPTPHIQLQAGGIVLTKPAPGGYGAEIEVTTGLSIGPAGPPVNILADGAAVTAGDVNLLASSLDSLNAGLLYLGGTVVRVPGLDSGGVIVGPGAVLRAPELLLQNPLIQAGATLTTIGAGAASSRLDDLPGNTISPGVLVLSNARPDFLNPPGAGGLITVENGATLLSENALDFFAPGGLRIGLNAVYGAKNIIIGAQQINIESTAVQADPRVPAGVPISQAELDALQRGVAGAPALQSLRLTATYSVNLFGSVSLSLAGSDSTLILSTPALYGYGATGETATITAATLVFNGLQLRDNGGPIDGTAAPGGMVAFGPQAGHGTLDLNVGSLVLGFPSLTQVDKFSHDRLVAGFATVNVNASDRIESKNKGALKVYESVPVYGQAGTGGVLNLNTPLLLGAAGSNVAVTAGGAITLASPRPASVAVALDGLGGQLDLTAPTITLDSAVALPSGRLGVKATDGISLGAGARVDLAGRAVVLHNVIRFVDAGSVRFETERGSITQAPGATIDVSAGAAHAGSLVVLDHSGDVRLAGVLLGGADAGFRSGTADIETATLSQAGYQALESLLTAGGFLGERDLRLHQGDLILGAELRGRVLDVSLDRGNLTVTGTVDASGARPGTIALAAGGNLTLAAGSLLDAHATVLQVDSYGQPIDAENRPRITLTTTGGTLSLAGGAAIDVASADAVARGRVILQAPRIAGTPGDVAIAAAGPVAITGAASIALDAFRTYVAPGGIVVQDTNEVTGGVAYPNALGLAQIDADSQAFIAAALRCDTAGCVLAPVLAGKLAGLAGPYRGTFHLRPGVEIVSGAADGGLSIATDLDLSVFRYASLDPAHQRRNTVAGSGEPGALVLRAGGDLAANGSVTDGFGAPPDGANPSTGSTNPDDFGWVLNTPDLTTVQGTTAADMRLPAQLAAGVTITLSAGTSLTATQPLNYPITLAASRTASNTVIPIDLQVPADTALGQNWITTAPIYTVDGAGHRTVVVPAGSTIGALQANWVVGAGSLFPVPIPVAAGTVWPAGVPLAGISVVLAADLVFSGNTVTNGGGAPIVVTGGALIEQGSLLVANDSSGFPLSSQNTRGTNVAGPNNTPIQGRIWALAPMLPAGSLSWDVGLVAGADTNAADRAAVQSSAALGTSGSILLADSHTTTAEGGSPFGSVLRTGTGDLSLTAGGDITQDSSFGIYTAGSQIAVDPSYQPARTRLPGGTILDQNNYRGAIYEPYVQASQTYYTTDGGDVRVAARGGITGVGGGDIVNWLWRQGGADGLPGAWSINFGTYVSDRVDTSVSGPPKLKFIAFTGIGALGGGNVDVAAGGDVVNVDIAAAGSGRAADGSLSQTGGGDVRVVVGGALANATQSPVSDVVDLRGGVDIQAGSIGRVDYRYDSADAADPRPKSPYVAEVAEETGGLLLAPGDSVVRLATLGDLVIATAVDPTRGRQVDAARVFSGVAFSLWTDRTAIRAISAGGDATPTIGVGAGSVVTTSYPGTLSVIAASGSLYYGEAGVGVIIPAVELAPSATGQLELLAANSIYGRRATIDMSSANADRGSLPSPFRPAFQVVDEVGNITATNLITGGDLLGLFAFEPDTATSPLHGRDLIPARITASAGDIVSATFGIGKVVEVFAGRDIVGSGITAENDTLTDISSVTAARDIRSSSLSIAGPGLLTVTAGRNFDLIPTPASGSSPGYVKSTGLAYGAGSDVLTGGAGLVITVGAGTGGPDYAALLKYLDPANAVNPNFPLVSGPNAGKVAHVYTTELLAWLRERSGFAGDATQALSTFRALAAEQQAVFLRQVYFAELVASGREETDPASRRYGSYVRGEAAIASLFPTRDAAGQPITYGGDFLLGTRQDSVGNPIDSGVQTIFGGDIQILLPGGGLTLGTNASAAVGIDSGLITFGRGNIDVFADGSVLLGKSRIFTTFGGSIAVWSAHGDIAAGLGAKTTNVAQPSKLSYDPYGQITTSPQIPTSGAGIATLAEIPGVPAGDVDLIAPTGTIDAGEAGIRASGNANLAARVIANASNITVKGKTTGVPVVAVPNVAAAVAGQAVAGAAENSLASVNKKRRRPDNIITVDVIGFGP